MPTVRQKLHLSSCADFRDRLLTDNGKVLLKTVHMWFGYVFAINLFWRIFWAFIGNRHARWAAFLPFKPGFGAALTTYLRGLIRGDARPDVGHNPVARLWPAPGSGTSL